MGADVLLATATAVAVEAATLARTVREAAIHDVGTKSSETDVVTAGDLAVEKLVRERLARLRPGEPVLGEEAGGAEPSGDGVCWVVDPIDGTVNYLYGLPDCAVSVAAEVDGQVVAGAVVTIPTGVEYAAALGQGATRDGLPISVRPSPPLGERLVLTGFGYQREVREHQAGCVAALLPEVRDIRRMGSCALDLCHVADGSGDGYVEAGPQAWDWSAGGLVLSEAGGRFDLLDGSFALGSHPVRNVVVGAPADGWDDFVAALAEAGFLA